MNNHYWAVVVNRAGVVCAVVFSGPGRDAQWLLSRQIAAAAWRTRNLLGLAPSVGNDRITLDAAAHPHCPNDADTQGKN